MVGLSFETNTFRQNIFHTYIQTYSILKQLCMRIHVCILMQAFKQVSTSIWLYIFRYALHLVLLLNCRPSLYIIIRFQELFREENINFTASAACTLYLYITYICIHTHTLELFIYRNYYE